MTADGLVIVDKPAGWTSHGVVGRLRKLLGTKKVGHAGTLDPMATGVLICGVNRATRLLGHLALHDKRYIATIRLGATTVTDDAQGELLSVGDTSSITDDDIRSAVALYVGEILQVPSAVSAIKVDGQRSYARVRAGEDVELKPRAVTITRYDVGEIRRVPQAVIGGVQLGSAHSVANHADHVACSVAGRVSGAGEVSPGGGDCRTLSGADGVGDTFADNQPCLEATPGTHGSSAVTERCQGSSPLTHSGGFIEVDVDVECSTGTYIRALARDLGRDLGVGGHLSMLRRTRIGVFNLDGAFAGLDGQEPPSILGMGEAARRCFPCVEVSDEIAQRVHYGQTVPVVVDADPTALVDSDGNLLALYRPDCDHARPVTVLVG